MILIEKLATTLTISNQYKGIIIKPELTCLILMAHMTMVTNLERSKRIFEESVELLEDVWHRIRYTVAAWVMGHKTLKSLHVTDLVRDWCDQSKISLCKGFLIPYTF